MLMFLTFLAACGAQPAPQFLGAKRMEANRNGRDYVIYQTDRAVQVIRLGYAKNGQHRQIRADMMALIPEVTGCRLTGSSLTGDSGQMQGRIRCATP